MLKKLLPPEKTWDELMSDVEDKEQTRNDQLIIIGWNMYRNELIKSLKF